MTHPDNECCLVCGHLDIKPRWERGPDGMRRLEGFCGGCGRHRLHLNAFPEALREADANEPKNEGPGLFDDREEG